MGHLHEGARQLPHRHISIRVPWNDTDWRGTVCRRPQDNTACMILPRIQERRTKQNDAQEITLAGRSWEGLKEDQLPPCVAERGSFMAPFAMIRHLAHPYAANSASHEHLLPTPFRFPPYSATCTPFGWTLSEMAVEKANRLELGYRPELETEAHALMGFGTEWLQTKHNQRVLLDTFFSAIQPAQSLCFFYAKRIPFVETTQRVLVGIGRVTHVGEPVEYLYKPGGTLRSVIWERAIQHSIRPGFADGFVLPYQAVLAYLDSHQLEDPEQFVAYVPDEQFEAFSYASEHVTDDGAIACLLTSAKTIHRIQTIVPGPWDEVLAWIDGRLNELWTMRGPCPGLGSALTAFGLPNGTLVAYAVDQLVADLSSDSSLDPWEVIDNVFRDPTWLNNDLRADITDSLRQKWALLPKERRSLLKLLSRFELTRQQAVRYYRHEDPERRSRRIQVSDAELLANPYLLYELDRSAPDPIHLPTVDRGLFPEQVVRSKYPLPAPCRVDDATDPRRVRAFVVQSLEQAALAGDTLRPCDTVIEDILKLDVRPACPVDSDLMRVVEGQFAPAVCHVALDDGKPAYQLERLTTMGERIRTSVEKRIKGIPHPTIGGWRARLDHELGGPAQPNDEEEQRARQEKAVALSELYRSRLAVLVGPAGTGKTTLLRVLCYHEDITAGGLLLLAPTGKARVRLEKETWVSGAKTIAQFLLRLDRYDPVTGAYRLSTADKVGDYKTVIIDEASMLTEDQLAALLDALKGVDRLILVGDPRQLPPIGAGRPFLDIIRRLTPGNVEAMFPRVAPSYAELTIRRRQRGAHRGDLLLADWFSGRPVDPGGDEIWARLGEKFHSKHLRFVRWDHPEELEETLLRVLVEELKLEGLDDEDTFEQTLGGSPHQGYMYFRVGNDGRAGACAKAEDWQILSPIRATPAGVELVNHVIQSRFRSRARSLATVSRWNRRVPEPMGPEGILYGDKVINVQNHQRTSVWPGSTSTGEHPLQYVANGEIGIVVGEFKSNAATYSAPPIKLQVEFASQPGFRYDYYPKRDFQEDGNPILELAYALTIHKAQGSEFKRTFVIIPNPCRLLSRELLYTALTRQRDHVIILHQGPAHDLKHFASDYYSETARRLTNLFQAPRPVKVKDRFLEEGLVHITRRGESVRSKSEVIIADLLLAKKIDYEYEQRLDGRDGTRRYPDFTINDAESGRMIYWEHLGRWSDPVYRNRWEKKLAWYREQDIQPLDEGGGSRGTLITTIEEEGVGLHVPALEALIDRVLSM